MKKKYHFQKQNQSKKSELKNHPNPFALVVLLQLAAIKTKTNDKKRMLSKLEYFRYLSKQGWDIEKSMNLYKFLDIILKISPDFEIEYIKQADQIKRENAMDIMTTFERLGYQKGIEQGITQGLEQGLEQGITQGLEQGLEQGMEHGKRQGEANLLINQLKIKFKDIPENYIDIINNSDINTLNNWGANFVFANSLEDVFKKQI